MSKYVKILKCTPSMWYNKRIGYVYEINHELPTMYVCLTPDQPQKMCGILKTDCELTDAMPTQNNNATIFKMHKNERLQFNYEIFPKD